MLAIACIAFCFYAEILCLEDFDGRVLLFDAVIDWTHSRAEIGLFTPDIGHVLALFSCCGFFFAETIFDVFANFATFAHLLLTPPNPITSLTTPHHPPGH